MVWLWRFLAVAAVVAAYWLGRRHAGRKQLYKALASIRGKLTENLGPVLNPAVNSAELPAAFDRERLVLTEAFLDAASLEAMRQEALAVMPGAVRSYIPAHKKGGTISYEKIHY